MKTYLPIVCAVLGIGMLTAGCGDREGQNGPDASAVTEAEPVRTLDDFRREARDEISAEDAEDELDRLEAEILGDSL